MELLSSKLILHVTILILPAITFFLRQCGTVTHCCALQGLISKLIFYTGILSYTPVIVWLNCYIPLQMSGPECSDESLSLKSKIVLEIDAFPFKGLNISENWKELNSVENRSTCSVCKKSRKYFCYTCYVAVPEIQDLVPKVKVSIILFFKLTANQFGSKAILP